MSEVERAADLYSVDPADFVEERKALAKRLKDAGDKEASAAVAKIRKPPQTAWALNLLARSDPDRIAALLDAAGTVVDALRGEGSDLRTAQADYTSHVAGVVEAAAELSGVSGDTMKDRMRGTVLAAGADPDGDVADHLGAGTLSADAEAPGFSFGALGQLPDPPARPAASERPATKKKSTGVSGRRASGSTKRTAPSSAKKAASDTKQQADDKQQQTEAAERRAEARAAEEAAQARRALIRERRKIERDLDRLQKRFDRLSARADEAEAAALEARTESDAAESELRETEQRLDALNSAQK